jgi:hypothetical protein
MFFWDQEAMAREDRAVIKEGQRDFVLKHQTSRHLPGNDLTKKAGQVIQVHPPPLQLRLFREVVRGVGTSPDSKPKEIEGSPFFSLPWAEATARRIDVPMRNGS